MNTEFRSVDELKMHVMPALKVRKRELKKQNIIMNEDEIWSYFAKNYWCKAYNLSLAQIVDNILNLDIRIK